MAIKRSGKFYRRNEEDVMRRLGLEPTKNSGSGWIEKEDGQSEEVICQLKSTDANSIRINKKDLDVLQYNASVVHKLPVFAIQFLQTDEVFLVMTPDTLQDVAKYLKTGEMPTTAIGGIGIDLSEHEDMMATPTRVIKSSSSAREEFAKETEKKFKKGRKSAT